jgi:diguanylate cyclase (GGDEF)-like protein
MPRSAVSTPSITTFCLAVLAAAGPLAADSRPVRFQRLSLDEGLSQTTVLSILQDRRGFMWFGTEDGLNRFDGAQVTVYARDASDPESLPNNVVWALAEGPEGDVWVGTEGGGIARWLRVRDRFVRYGTRQGLASDNVRALLVDRRGLVWIGTRDAGLDVLDPRTGAVRHYRHRPDDAASLSDDSVYVLAEDRSGALWIGTNGGLDRLDAERKQLVRFGRDAKRPRGLGDNRVRSLFQDAEGKLWIGTEGGGLSMLDSSGRLQQWRTVRGDRQSLSHDTVRALLEDDAGRLWVGTRQGLNLLEREDGHFQRYASNPADPRSLGDDEIMSLYQDQGGVLWVGTRTAGVHRWNPRTWSFGHRRSDAEDPHSLSQDYVTSFSMAPSGRLFVGTFGGGLDAFDRAAGTVVHYRHRPQQPGSLSDDRVMALLHDRRGRLWVGTMDGGLNLFDAATGTFRVYRHDPSRADSLSSNAVMSLFEDRRGGLWVGTFRGGLNRLDPARGTFVRYRHVPGDAKTLGSDSITAMAEDGSGALWVGTDSGGLGLLRPETGEVRTFRHDPSDPHSLPANTVFGLHVDASGRLWAGTRGGGLAVLERLEEGRAAFRTYTERDGLPNAVVYGIHPDASGNLWMSTNAGLAVLDGRRARFRTYGVMHGLQSKEFNFGAHYRSGAGEMFFGGPQGFNAFIPESLHQGARSPRLALTGLLKLNVPVRSEVPVAQLQEVQLDHRDQVVTFEFAALDYTAPELNRFAYMLEGFDGQWMDLGRFRRVTYTNLDAGRYVLRVKAWNADGVASERPLEIQVRVLPPPWRTWWAWLGYAIIVAAAAWAFVHNHRRQRHREAQYRRQLETEVQTRTRELAQQNSRLEELNGRLLETSLSDSLTGLRNRRFFFEEVSREVAVLQRSAQQHGERDTRRLVFIMVDLDWFKPINDTCGHSVGDRVLLQVKDILLKACRRSDILVRWGGDEFLVVGEETDAARIETIPERIRAAIERSPFDLGNGQVARLTCSLGFTSFPWNRTQDLGRATVEQVLALADAALYMAKKAGRNCWLGLLGTERTSVDDLVRSTQDGPDRLIESGHLAVTTSRNVVRRPVEAEESLQRAAPGA